MQLYRRTVKPTVHTNPSRKRTIFKPEEHEHASFAFSVDGKHFENGDFRNRLR